VPPLPQPVADMFVGQRKWQSMGLTYEGTVMSKQTGRHKFNFETGKCEHCGVSEERHEDNARPCPGESRPQPRPRSESAAALKVSIVELLMGNGMT
jgi:ribosomal protein L37E